MNPVLIVTHNCLQLTQKCIASIDAQDRETRLLVIDNGSTDGTAEWLEGRDQEGACFSYNAGFSMGMNTGLRILFGNPDVNHVLCPNNDTILPPWFYSELLAYDVPFITGVSVDSMDAIARKPERSDPAPHPDFSCFLIRRDAWEEIGPFNERMKNYASDNDWHIRAHRRGIPLLGVHLPFYHERSSTLRQAPPHERRLIEDQANVDRQEFRSIYGFNPWDKEYGEAFSVETFGSQKRIACTAE